MTGRSDPPRLRTMSGDLPAELSAALAEGSSDFPRSDQLEDLTRRMGPLLGAASIAAAIPIATMAPKAPLTASAALKLAAIKWSHIVVLPLAIGAASGAAVWKATYQASEDSHATPVSIEMGTAATNAKAAAKSKGAVETRGANEDDRPEAESETLAPPKITARSAARPALDPRAGAQRAPTATEEPIAPASEIELIERAHRALSQAPPEARRWAAEHARLYPDGTFVQERETLIIEALAREGRVAEADDHAARFRIRFAGSTYLQRIDSVLRAAHDSPRVPRQ